MLGSPPVERLGLVERIHSPLATDANLWYTNDAQGGIVPINLSGATFITSGIIAQVERIVYLLENLGYISVFLTLEFFKALTSVRWRHKIGALVATRHLFSNYIQFKVNTNPSLSHPC